VAALERDERRGMIDAQPVQVGAVLAAQVEQVLIAERPDRLDTGLPAAALTAGLRARGHTAETSRSAGRYLCNFLYYLSLEWAARQESPPLALFMHVPPGPAQGGSFSEAALLRGAQETLRLVLAFASDRDAATPIADRTGPGFALSEARLNAKEA